MAFTISYVIQAVNSFTPSANQIANSVRRLRDRMLDLSRSVRRASERMRDMGGRMTVGITAPIGLFAGAAVQAAANLETLEVGFQSMLGSAEAAKSMMGELTQFTAKTPFQLQGVATSAKMLLGFGVASEDVKKTLGSLGNVASASGSPIQDLARIFGQVKATGVAMTGDLKEFANRGIPILDVLAKQFDTDVATLLKGASNSEVKFKDVAKAFETMNKEGGFAFNAMANQSKTLAGVFSTFKDNVNLSLGAVGEQLNKTLDITGTLERFTGVIANMGQAFVRFSENNPRLAKFLIIMVHVLSILGPLLASLGFMALGVSAIVPIFVALGSAMFAAFAFIISPIGLVVAAIAAVIAGIVLLVKNWDFVKEVMSTAVDFMAEKVKQGFDAIVGVIKFAGVFIATHNPFAVILTFLNFLIQKITGFDILSFLPDTLRSFVGLDVEAPSAAGGTAESGLATAGAGNGTTDININLSDREGLVDSIASSSRGNGSVPLVGRNM